MAMDSFLKLECPICFRIPDKEILQCRNGHTLCDACYSKLSLCPQCRVCFGKDRIRSLIAESLLDEIEFECLNKELGCPEKFKRQLLAGHSSTCSFREPSQPLCRRIGFNCDFQLRTSDLEVAVQHLRTDHGCGMVPESYGAAIHLQNFVETSTSTTFKSLRRGQWKPTIWRMEGEVVILVCKVHSEDKTMSVGAVMISKGCVLKASQLVMCVKTKNLSWMIPPVSLTEANLDAILSAIRIPLRFLRNCLTSKNLLELKVEMSINPWSIINAGPRQQEVNVPTSFSEKTFRHELIDKWRQVQAFAAAISEDMSKNFKRSLQNSTLRNPGTAMELLIFFVVVLLINTVDIGTLISDA